MDTNHTHTSSIQHHLVTSPAECGWSMYCAYIHAVATVTATSVLFCVVVSVLVTVIMALSVKIHQLTKQGQCTFGN